MSSSTSVTRSFTDYSRALLGHAWLILTFRHRGQGLDLATPHLLLISLLAASLAAITALVPVASVVADPYSVAQVAAVALLAFGGCFVLLGRSAAAGLVVLIILTEPLAIVFRLAFAQPDYYLSVWTLVAQFVFFLRCKPGRAESR